MAEHPHTSAHAQAGQRKHPGSERHGTNPQGSVKGDGIMTH